MPYCLLIFNKNNRKECQKVTPASPGIKKAAIADRFQESHFNLGASLKMMVKGWH